MEVYEYIPIHIWRQGEGCVNTLTNSKTSAMPPPQETPLNIVRIPSPSVLLLLGLLFSNLSPVESPSARSILRYHSSWLSELPKGNCPSWQRPQDRQLGTDTPTATEPCPGRACPPSCPSGRFLQAPLLTMSHITWDWTGITHSTDGQASGSQCFGTKPVAVLWRAG